MHILPEMVKTAHDNREQICGLESQSVGAMAVV